MFTIKLYTDNGSLQRIYEADNFTVLRSGDWSPNTAGVRSWAEVTAHRKNGDDFRFDIGDSPYQPSAGVWEKVIIENAAGRTTEIIGQNIPLLPLGNEIPPAVAA